MTDSSDNIPEDPRVSLAEQRTVLAAERTRFAAERSLMAWIRTSISMVAFGFSIYKFFEYFAALPGISREFHARAPRNLGLALIALGTVALAAAVVEHVGLMRRLSAHHRVRVSLVLVVAVLIVFFGLLAFLGVLLGVGPFSVIVRR